MTTTRKPVTIATALLAAQKAMPAIQRDAINPHFRSKFVSLDSLVSAIVPVLNEHGLVLSQFPTALENGNGPAPALRTRLTHAESGEWIEDTMLLLAGKDDPQGQGSAITYARRYALMAILGLVADEDDDGARASRSAGGPRRDTQSRETGPPAVASVAPSAATAPPAESSSAAQLPSGKPATDAQKKKLRAVADELQKTKSITLQQLDSAAQKIVGRDFTDAVDQFSMAEASELIGRLEKLKKNTGA